ncbi:MAG: DUF309 domain-containing protein [Prochloraceae cyanobacterium]|nr:DUF309 domain-containing protein [Prochloraceae cyanobacterium]
MPPQQFWQGVEEFNQLDFYACHDTLEALWLESSDPDRKFYQGVLQIAVSCHHLRNNNWRGAVILLGEGVKRISEYQPIYEEIDVTQLLEESCELLATIQQTEPERAKELAERLEKESKESQGGWPKIHRISS